MSSKVSNNKFFGSTAQATDINKQSQIGPDGKPLNSPFSTILQSGFISSAGLRGSGPSEASQIPYFESRLKTLVDCKSANSERSEHSSSMHVSIAASLNTSNHDCQNADDKLFRTIKQMTSKNLPDPLWSGHL